MKKQPTDFEKKLNEITAMGGYVYPEVLRAKILSAFSELAKECKPERISDAATPGQYYNDAIDEYEKNLLEALK